MRFFERFRELRERAQSVQSEPASGATVAQVRREANDLLAAGADAINRTLSSDSELFLNSCRQQGGQ